MKKTIKIVLVLVSLLLASLIAFGQDTTETIDENYYEYEYKYDSKKLTKYWVADLQLQNGVKLRLGNNETEFIILGGFITIWSGLNSMNYAQSNRIEEAIGIGMVGGGIGITLTAMGFSNLIKKRKHK